MNLEYALWTGAWCILGTIAGMKLLAWVLKKWNRQSPIVALLVLILGISALLIPIFGAIEIINKTQEGANVFEFKLEDLCSAAE
jgi:hypothetical protein